jgi:hypothetical protein
LSYRDGHNAKNGEAKMHIEEIKQLYMLATGAISLAALSIILAIAAGLYAKRCWLELVLPAIRGSVSDEFLRR